MSVAISKESLLIELGTEELPPKALKKLSAAFSEQILAGLLEAQLINDLQLNTAEPFATPRRLALLVPDVLSAQPSQSVERRGPAVATAFKDDGQATPAALGFAKSCGVEVDDLERLKTDKGEWLSYNIEEIGKDLSELLPEIMDRALKRLPIAKRMRWGNGTAEFVRPVHWLIVMHGEDIVPVRILDLLASNFTRGHRFHSSGELTINHADSYKSQLANEGLVIASFAERQAEILLQVTKAAKSIDATIEHDQALLDEVTGLVEKPTAILGSFDKTFLDVPQECLVSSMRDHQKYFHVVDEKGKLKANFITLSNISSKHPERVQLGNERVLRARLADAQFFWQTDQKTKLESGVEKLGSVLFHSKLGSILDKTHRVQTLAGIIAKEIGADQTITKRAALLAKADLVSNMVGEFDSLQGIMGHYYADFDKEPAAVGEAIEQHYWPKFAGDRLPINSAAQAIALADRLDSLVGLIGAGEKPSGDKDRYALRRAALAILRILIEQKLPLKMSTLIANSAKIYSKQQAFDVPSESQEEIVDFIRGRLTAYYQQQDIPTSTINAVMSCKPDSPLDFEQRLKAVSQFAARAEATDLAAANKRIGNILKKHKRPIKDVVDSSLLVEAAEIQLNTAIETIQQDCKALFDSGEYASGLEKLATLRTPVDDFFENVMVMAEDKGQQSNRLALLARLQQLFLRVADISLLQN